MSRINEHLPKDHQPRHDPAAGSSELAGRSSTPGPPVVRRLFQPFSGVGHRVGGEPGSADYREDGPLDAATLRERRLAALTRGPAIQPPASAPDASTEAESAPPDQLLNGRPMEREVQRLQQLRALRERGLLPPSGVAFHPHQSNLDAHLAARDEARAAKTNALQQHGITTQRLRALDGRRARLGDDLATAQIIDPTSIGPLAAAVDNQWQIANAATQPSVRDAATDRADRDLTALEQAVADAIADHTRLMADLDAAYKAGTARVKRAAADATFDQAEIGTLARAFTRAKKQADARPASPLGDVQRAIDAMRALDTRATEDCQYLDLIAKVPSGIDALESGEAFSRFRRELKERGTGAWAAFKTAVATSPRTHATCLQHLSDVTEFYATKEDLAARLKGSSEVKKGRAVTGLLGLAPVAAYAQEGADRYMLGQLIAKTPGPTGQGADAEALKQLLSIPNVTATSLLDWLTPPATTGPEVPTVDENARMLRWANDGTAFARLRQHFAGTLRSQLYGLLERCAGEGPSLKYLAVDKNKDFDWLDALTKEHSATQLETYLKSDSGQQFWRSGQTCAAPAPSGGSTLDQIIANARPLTRNNRDTVRNHYAGNREFGNRGTIEDVAADGTVTTSKCMALPTRRDNAAISYREYDLKIYTGTNRGARRFVVGSDGSRYYTSDHYGTFQRFKEPT